MNDKFHVFNRKKEFFFSLFFLMNYACNDRHWRRLCVCWLLFIENKCRWYGTNRTEDTWQKCYFVLLRFNHKLFGNFVSVAEMKKERKKNILQNSEKLHWKIEDSKFSIYDCYWKWKNKCLFNQIRIISKYNFSLKQRTKQCI